ncbi:MAG TPA: hypothetical protein VF575_03045 [Candidatus Saccharimonadales bacterium]|jgi:F0F1-type ATP synthase epsilon subunit
MADDTKTPATAAAGADSVKTEKKEQHEVPIMHVRVSSPFKTFFDDDAASLSGVNASGPFDILPHHHNFISLLSEAELVIKTLSGEDVRVRISGGIMHVKADQVIIFLNV